MVRFAYVFPGQGAQYAGMGKSLYEGFPIAKGIFDKADKNLDFNLSELCFNGPQEELSKTPNCQPAILTVSIAALRIFEGLYAKALGEPVFTAGLSLGEYSALVASGVLEFSDAVGLVRKRGIFMEEASQKNPGKMLAILGISIEEVNEVCKRTNTEIANLNSPGQVIISGKIPDVENAALLSKQLGAKKTFVLDVSGPFHSSLMNEARDLLKSYIEQVNFSSARIPVISNFSANAVSEPTVIKDNLINQVNHTTKWGESVRYMLSNGVSKFIEIGPGNVLRGLIRKIAPEAVVYNIEDAKSIEDFNPNFC